MSQPGSAYHLGYQWATYGLPAWWWAYWLSPADRTAFLAGYRDCWDDHKPRPTEQRFAAQFEDVS